MSLPSFQPRLTPVALWLFVCTAMVFLMVVIGGLTRLTESGLSIVEWRPIAGIIPPIGEQAWLEEFAKYRQTPEYIAVNFGMSLTAFKSIFFLEYLHRLLGRLAGCVFLLPFLYFSLRKQLNKELNISLAAIFLLGGVQGIIGWYMVKSGLQHDPHVSHYRLALHLGCAFIIEGLLLWAALSVWYGPCETKQAVPWHITVTLLAIFFQVVTGAFVAGLHAGLIYNSFPLMDGKIIPSGLWIMEPWYKNILENVTMVQFIHRLSAYGVALLVATLWIRVQCFNYAASIKNSVNFLAIMLIIQLTLGVLTLLYHVPVILASLHQAGAMVLFSLCIHCLYISRFENAVGLYKRQLSN